jgi:hypothetical protein
MGVADAHHYLDARMLDDVTRPKGVSHLTIRTVTALEAA